MSVINIPAGGRVTRERTPTRMVIFGREKYILKTMLFRYVTTLLNERKLLKMVIRSVPDSVSLIFGRPEWPGRTALHRAVLVD